MPKNKRKMENRKINVETNSHSNKLSTRTNAFHQLFHQRQQPTLSKNRLTTLRNQYLLIFAFSGLGEIEHTYDTPTCLGHLLPSLGAKRTRLRYFEHVRGK